jgi:hypothetical protein
MKTNNRDLLNSATHLIGHRVYDKFGFERGVVCGCEGDRLFYQASGFAGWWQSRSEALLKEVEHISDGSVWLNRDLRRYWELDQHDDASGFEFERFARRA